MYSPSSDLDILTAMVDDLEAFMKSDVVYWQLSDAGPFIARNPKLTVGGLLLHRHRLAALYMSLTPEEQITYARLAAHLERQIVVWQANVERKALREIHARLRPWAWYLDDCSYRPHACASSYHTDVYSRTYLQLLFKVQSDGSNTVSVRAQLDQLDSQLRSMFISGEFAWDAALEPAFPATEFWFLHGQPSSNTC